MITKPPNGGNNQKNQLQYDGTLSDPYSLSLESVSVIMKSYSYRKYRAKCFSLHITKIFNRRNRTCQTVLSTQCWDEILLC